MDKRSFSFFITVMISVFLVQMFFAYRDQQRKADYLSELEQWKAQRKEKLAENAASRTLAPKDLPLVALFSEKEDRQVYRWALKMEEQALILAGDEEEAPPAILYSGANNALKWEQLDVKEGVALYAIQGSQPEEFMVAEWPTSGVHDIQLVQLHTQMPAVTLAVVDQGHFTAVLEMPEENALAVAKVGERFLPLGTYQSASGSIQRISGMTTSLNFPVTDEREGQRAEEQFFVLENGVQQLVFSSRGGSLVELNLPFQDESNPESQVLEIGFDKAIVEETPYNAHFPAHPYFTPGASPAGPYVSHEKGELGGYYPLIRRSLQRRSATETVELEPAYYGLNVVSLNYPEVGELNYQVKHFSENQITFEAVQRHRRITKTFTLDPKVPYIIDLVVKVDRDSRELWLSSGVPEVEMISNASTPALKYRATRNQKAEVESISLPKDGTTMSDLYPDWICNSNGFFGIIMDSIDDMRPGFHAYHVAGNRLPSRLVELDQGKGRFKADALPGYQMLVPLPSKPGTSHFRIYAGPFAESSLKAADAAFSNPETGYNPDYMAAQSFHGWFRFISQPFAKFLFFLMKLFHRVTDSWALSIVLLTVVLRLMLYPLNNWSMKSMKRMQQIQPEVTAIQAKFKKDPKRAQMEVMQLYRTRGVNPLSGCLPMLIQIPFLIGMFDLLKSTFDLRGAPFIPGWIDDLAAPDVLFSWNTHIFFVGTELHLLPLLLGVVMFFQSRMSSTIPKDQPLTEQQRQQKMMSNMMMVMFTVMFYNFPSGLNIYWLSSMILSMIQQWWVNRQLDQGVELQQPSKSKSKTKTRAKAV